MKAFSPPFYRFAPRLLDFSSVLFFHLFLLEIVDLFPSTGLNKIQPPKAADLTRNLISKHVKVLAHLPPLRVFRTGTHDAKYPPLFMEQRCFFLTQEYNPLWGHPFRQAAGQFQEAWFASAANQGGGSRSLTFSCPSLSDSQ